MKGKSLRPSIPSQDPDLNPPPPPAFDPKTYPRTYRPRPAWMVFGAAAVAIFAGMSVWIFLGKSQWNTPWLDIGVPAALLLFAMLAVVDLVRTRFVLHIDRIEQVGVFGSRELSVQDIESWRLLDTQYVKHIRLQAAQGAGRSMKIALTFKADVPWAAWLGRLRSADEEGRQAALARVLGDDELGMLPGDRLRVLSQAQRLGKFAVWGVYIAGMWAIYASKYTEQVVTAFLCLPVAALLLAGVRPTLLTLQEPRRSDVRVSLWPAMVMGAIAPMAVAIKTLAIASAVSLIAPAVIVGVAATAWALIADPTVRERKAAVAGIAIPMILYGGALVVWLNHILPPLQETRAVVTVTGIRVSHPSRGGQIFRVSIGPAATTVAWHELEVPRSTWEHLQAGSLACLDERRGMLGVTEATVGPCPDVRLPAPSS